MGILRTIFAISVIFAHSWPTGLMFVGGRNAVQLFYIISGFLISYVLVEKKSYKKISTFYLNRYLRLYPIYFCVVVLTVTFFFISKQTSFIEVYKTAPNTADILLIFSNLFLIGQDWVMFSGVENNHLVFTPNFLKSDVVLYTGLVVPQAWTLGLELTFYLVAPFVLQKRRLIVLLLVLSLACRLLLIKLGVGTKDPWTYRFFPTELALFLLGALAHQVLLPLYNKLAVERLKIISIIATGVLIIFSLTYFILPLAEAAKAFLLFAAFILFIPLTFVFQNNYRLDSYIGNLSYPIYISHMLVIWIISYLAWQLKSENQYIFSLICVLATVGFAILLDKYVGLPFENIRKGIRNERVFHIFSLNERAAK